MTTTVSDSMRTNVITADRNDTVLSAARSMRQSAIGDVVVTDKGRLHGIVTDRDLVVRCMAEALDPEATRLDDICSQGAVTLSPDDELDTAIQRMKDSAVRRLPVVSDDRVVGILSLGDLAQIRERHSALGEVSAAPPNA